jgi:hypothetical protein
MPETLVTPPDHRVLIHCSTYAPPLPPSPSTYAHRCCLLRSTACYMSPKSPLPPLPPLPPLLEAPLLALAVTAVAPHDAWDSGFRGSAYWAWICMATLGSGARASARGGGRGPRAVHPRRECLPRWAAPVSRSVSSSFWSRQSNPTSWEPRDSYLLELLFVSGGRFFGRAWEMSDEELCLVNLVWSAPPQIHCTTLPHIHPPFPSSNRYEDGGWSRRCIRRRRPRAGECAKYRGAEERLHQAEPQ